MSSGYYDPQDEENREAAARKVAAAHMDDMSETGDRWRTVARFKDEFHDRLKDERETRR